MVNDTENKENTKSENGAASEGAYTYFPEKEIVKYSVTKDYWMMR